MDGCMDIDICSDPRARTAAARRAGKERGVNRERERERWVDGYTYMRASSG